MQQVTATTTSTTNAFDQLRAGVLVDTSSQSRAFSSFMGLCGQSGNGADLQSQATQINAGLDLATRPDAVSTASADAASGTGSTVTLRAASVDDSLSTAKNSPVSREAFEESRPLLAKAGLSDSEIEDLSARVQAGTLTWGQMVQSLGGHMTGSKKSVKLSDAETAQIQSLLQRLGFAGDAAAQMAQSVGQGDGLKVLSAIQNKLSGMSDDTSLGMDKGELATLFKALRVPQATSDKLLQSLGDQSTAGDLKNALATLAQSLQNQNAKTGAKDTALAKSVAKVMEKDTAKSARDSGQTATDSSGGQVGYELKTKDKNDTSWFNQHESSQKKANDEVWKSFNSKVRTDESVTQSSLSQSTQTQAKDALDALAGKTAQAVSAQQTKTEAGAQAKTYEKVAAPKVLDQVSQAMLKDLGQGRKQLTLSLDPENLGKVQVMLQVKGKEVSAVIKAEDADTAAMLNSHMDSLKKTLEDQGLTVQNLEVQTGLAGNQQQQTSFNAEQHNQAQEQQELAKFFSQMRLLRADSGDVASDVQSGGVQAILADRGLHLIA